jgi:polysaccharide biosynthesis/export protein
MARGTFLLTLVAFTACLAGPLQAQDMYELGPGDIVSVAVGGQSTLTGDFALDADGMLSLPILGRVKASEMTAAELERKLATLLADGYLKNPQVSVVVKVAQGIRVFVTGLVAKPGAYPLTGDRTLLSLLNSLGGVIGEGHEIIVIRPPAPEPAAPVPAEGAEPAPSPSPESPTDPAVLALPNFVPRAEVIRVNRAELLSGNPEKNIRLQSGDTVYVPPASNVYVTGHAGRPGPYRYEPGMTVYQLLLKAGGVSPRGSSGGIRIIRVVNGKEVKLKARPTDLVQPEDRLDVPERFF